MAKYECATITRFKSKCLILKFETVFRYSQSVVDLRSTNNHGYGNIESAKYKKSISYCGIFEECEKENIIPQSKLEIRSQSLSASNLFWARKHMGFINLQSLDLCLYELESEREKSLVRMMSQDSQGRLCFSVAFDVENRCLTVCILEAKLSTEFNYVTSPSTPNPIWCQTASFKKNRKKQGPDTRVFMKLNKLDGSCLQQSTKSCRNTLEPVYG